ncbi:MAG: hypothetical protein AB7I42_04730 [Bradyrhizobium sp.]|uniref:hypothetical protein n=1 Tax=Bradyrhizobium sp. TaxID=376 RepID=UPI0035443D8F
MKEKPLNPNDFPITTDEKKLIRQDGKKIADAITEAMADDIAERLNENAARKREDRWAL